MSLSVAITHRQGDFTLEAAFEVPDGLTVLLGPSGSGKTTLVNALAGLIRPDRARIVVGGRVLADTAAGVHLPPYRRRIGYVFQDARLFPHLSVRQNLLFGRWFAPRGEPGEGLARIVEMLDIGPLLDRRPGALSGGERSRVALGRALLSSPRLILADEPLAALDDTRKAEILPYFERLRDQTRVPVLYVTHSMAEVARLATTVVALRQGKVVAVGPAAQVLGDPQAMGAREVTSVLNARLVAHHEDGLSELACAAGPLWLPRIEAPPGAPIAVRIAAHEVILSRTRPEGLSAQNILPATITALVSGDGPGMIVHLKIGEDAVLARITRRAGLQMGLEAGQSLFAVLKSMSVARDHIGPAPGL